MNSSSTRLESLISSLRRISQGQGNFNSDTRQQMREILNRLTSPTVTITFGGHFSSGKSTLLNAALQRSLLPTLDLPDTGAVCTLRAGAQDHVDIISANGVNQTIPCTTAAISQHISLRLASGMENKKVHQIKEVKITLANSPIPAPTIWVDSPGINETQAMMERAYEAARKADILVWVLNSHQFLALSEAAFIAEYVNERGTDAILFITNIFLKHDTIQDWHSYLNENGAALRKRLSERAPDLGFGQPPETIMVSARAVCSVHGNDARFGAQDLRGLLATFTNSNHPRVQRARLFQAGSELRTIVATLQAGLRQERESVQKAQKTYEQQRQEVLRHQQRFTTDIESTVNQFLASWRSQARASAQAVARSINADTLARTGSTYSNNLNTQLKSATTQAMSELQKRIVSAVGQHKQRSFDSSSMAKLQALLTSPAISVQVPDSTPAGGNAAAKIGAGLAIGSIVPGIGHLAGALIGAGVAVASAYSAHSSARQRDAEQTKMNVSTETERAISAMDKKRAEAVALIVKQCASTIDIPQPSTAKVDSLENQLRMATQLVQLAEELVKGM